MSLSAALRKGLKAFRGVEQPDIYTRAIKDAAANAPVRGIGDIFNNAPMSVIDNRLHINNVPMNRIENFLRRSELRKFADSISSTVRFTAADERAFARTLTHLPDPKLKNLDDAISSAKISHPELHKSATTGDELRQVLTPAAKTKFENAFNKIKAAAAGSLVVAGTFAVLDLAKNMYDAAVETAEKRKGCHLVREANNNTYTCKLSNRSCVNQNSDKPCPQDNVDLPSASNLYNPTLMLLWAALKDETLASKLRGLFTPPIEITPENMGLIVNNSERFEILQNFYNDERPLISNICELQATQVENGVVPFCRACMPSADQTNTQFVEVSELAENYTFVCITTASVLESFIDIGEKLGLNLFGNVAGFSGDLSGNFKYGFIALIVIFISVLVYAIFSRFKK